VSISSWVVTPNFSAIALSVSPGCTTYFCPAAAEAGAWLLGGAALLAGAEGGAWLLAGAELLAGALGPADRLALGVADRDALGVAPRTGVFVAPLSRVQAPSKSAPHITPAATPRRKRCSRGRITPSWFHPRSFRTDPPIASRKPAHPRTKDLVRSWRRGA
jgi:hypothetical protein